MRLNTLCAPAVKAMAKFRFPTKFLSIACIFAIPLSLVMYYFLHEINHNIEFASDEISGVALASPVSQFMEDVLLYQQKAFGKDTSDVDNLLKNIDKDIEAIDAVDKTEGAHLKVSEDWKKVKTAWATLRANEKSATAEKNRGAYNEFMGQVSAFITSTGNSSNLILDPDIDSYYTMDTALTQNPNLLINLAQARDLASSIVQTGKISTHNKLELAVLMERVNLAMGNINNDIKQAVGYNASLKDSFEQIRTPFDKSVMGFIQTINQKFIYNDQLNKENPSEVALAGNAAISAGQSYRKSAMGTLRKLLETRRGGFYTRRLSVTVVTCVTLLLGTYLFLGFYLLTMKSLKGLVRVSEALSVGDIEQEIVTVSHDEVAEVEKAFSRMVTYQRNIAVVAEAISNGNLTQNITVQSDKDVLGNAFYTMTSNLRHVISSVATNTVKLTFASNSLSEQAQDARYASESVNEGCRQVSDASNQCATTSQEIARASEEQAGVAQDTIVAMQGLHKAIDNVQAGGERQSLAITEVSEGIKTAAETLDQINLAMNEVSSVAKQSTQTAQQGSTAVTSTIESIAQIQEQFQNSSRCIKSLGSKSREIESIVETINQIAEQTNLLALNAAIEAARAGEHGRGFAVVASEVRKLAERASSATRGIEELIRDVQNEVRNAVSAIEESSRNVQKSTEQSMEAGAALTHIQSSAEAVKEHVESVARSVEQLSAITEEVVAGLGITQETLQQNAFTMQQMLRDANHVEAAMGRVANATQMTAAGAEEMSAMSQEVSAEIRMVSDTTAKQLHTVSEISHSAETLHDMASVFNELAARFQWENQTNLTVDTMTEPSEQKKYRKAA